MYVPYDSYTCDLSFRRVDLTRHKNGFFSYVHVLAQTEKTVCTW